MRPRLVAACATSSVIAIALAACGGRLDTTPDAGPVPSATATTPVPLPVPLPTPSSPVPPSPLASSAAAAAIADAYCASFATCCQALDATVDASRCRTVTSAAVMKRIDSGKGTITPSAVAACVGAVRVRTAACGKEDAKWWLRDDVALLGPASVRSACRALLGPGEDDEPPAACGPSKPCPADRTCAIDECVIAGSAGESCGGVAGAECLDGATCDGSLCYVRLTVRPGVMCSEDASCRLGFGCVSSMCQTLRATGGAYKERHSPYRVAADTCKVFNYL